MRVNFSCWEGFTGFGCRRQVRAGFHIGGFSKTLNPGLRLGFLVVPPALTDLFGTFVGHLAPAGSVVAQQAVQNFMADGHFYPASPPYEGHCTRAVRRYWSRICDAKFIQEPDVSSKERYRSGCSFLIQPTTWQLRRRRRRPLSASSSVTVVPISHTRKRAYSRDIQRPRSLGSRQVPSPFARYFILYVRARLISHRYGVRLGALHSSPLGQHRNAAVWVKRPPAPRTTMKVPQMLSAWTCISSSNPLTTCIPRQSD